MTTSCSDLTGFAKLVAEEARKNLVRRGKATIMSSSDERYMAATSTRSATIKRLAVTNIYPTMSASWQTWVHANSCNFMLKHRIIKPAVALDLMPHIITAQRWFLMRNVSARQSYFESVSFLLNKLCGGLSPFQSEGSCSSILFMLPLGHTEHSRR